MRGRLAYEMTSGVIAGVNISYDKAFDTRVSADLKVRFGGSSTKAKPEEVQQLPVINALTSTPSNRDVRVHDMCFPKVFKVRVHRVHDICFQQCEDESGPFNHRLPCGADGVQNIWWDR